MAWEPKDPTGRSGQDPFDEVFKKGQELFRRFMPTRGIGMIIVIVLGLLVLSQSFYTVQPAEMGLVKRFGDVVRTEGPGLNFKIPFVETVLTPQVENCIASRLASGLTGVVEHGLSLKKPSC